MENKTKLSKYSAQVNNRETFMFFTPGRINLMGEHTYYTGGKALLANSHQGIWLFIRLTKTNEIKLKSEFLNTQIVVNSEKPDQITKTWIDYPTGVINKLVRQGMKFTGMELVFLSDLPFGESMGSSAALGMVTAFALNRIFNLNLDRLQLSKLVSDTENNLAGVQCGITDSYSIAFGESRKAIHVDFHELTHNYIPLNLEEYSFVIVQSNVKHKLRETVYNRRVQELQQVLQIVNQYFEITHLGSLQGADYDWLDKMIEDEILKRRLRHVVNENTRVELAVEYLEANKYTEFGKLMFDSHNSLAYDFEVSSKELDVLVNLAQTIEGVLGARMIGAGFGGSTINLVKKGMEENFITKVLAGYSKQTGQHGEAFTIYPGGQLHQLQQEIS